VQEELVFKTWGGKREGAGRPKKGFGASERHQKRDEVRASWPVHVTLRVGGGVPYLRKRKTWQAIAKATLAARAIRIVHASVQHNHVHLLVEASDQYALSKGMHAFQVSAAHWINRAAGRRGRVFPDRYHAHVLKTPREARNALRYVLCNWRKHGEDANACCSIDFYSTGYAFWNERPPNEYDPLPISQAESWLLREGWRRAGPIGPREVPGATGGGRAR